MNISGTHSTINSANVRFGLEDTTCVTEPPSEKAVINAACEEKLESVTVVEGANAFPLFVCVPPHMQLTYFIIYFQMS